ncbi:unnamed protein product [Urochloa humidicola]
MVLPFNQVQGGSNLLGESNHMHVDSVLSIAQLRHLSIISPICTLAIPVGACSLAKRKSQSSTGGKIICRSCSRMSVTSSTKSHQLGLMRRGIDAWMRWRNRLSVRISPQPCV